MLILIYVEKNWVCLCNIYNSDLLDPDFDHKDAQLALCGSFMQEFSLGVGKEKI